MNDDTLLHRQVHPNFVDSHGETTSQAFRPTPKDKNQLSVYDGNLISAENAWKHYTNDLQLRSIGVMSVSVAECRTLELPVVPDAETFPGARAYRLQRFEQKAN